MGRNAQPATDPTRPKSNPKSVQSSTPISNWNRATIGPELKGVYNREGTKLHTVWHAFHSIKRKASDGQEMERFQNELSKQLRFLETSCSSFDKGFQDEAVRLATVLRTMFKDSGSMKSLLTHLEAWDKISMVSYAAETRRMKELLGDSAPEFHGNFIFSSEEGSVSPMSDSDAPFSQRELVTPDNWWSGAITAHGGEWITRQALILTAADKDGGAHVDAKLTPVYEALGSRTVLNASTEDGEQKKVPIQEHYISIRQCAQEVIDSEQLSALA